MSNGSADAHSQKKKKKKLKKKSLAAVFQSLQQQHKHHQDNIRRVQEGNSAPASLSPDRRS
jgi:hypothetical protein